jgi:uncharacterized membrane protein
MDLSDASEKFPSDTTGIDPGTFRLAAQRLKHYVTPGPCPDGMNPKFNIYISELTLDSYKYIPGAYVTVYYMI